MTKATDERPANRLVHETSPYLRQHAHNPVHWYPWGEEALALARAQKRPIFLSIGYSACHWCHVMERECFENDQIAALMNKLYVNIKVDREERPDIDDIYMKAVVALNGSGGWPMSVFLTPDLRPFFGGTYFPPVRVNGRPSFPDVLVGLAEAYENEHEKVAEQASQLTALIEAEAKHDARGRLPEDILDRSLSQLRERFDPQWGGFGNAPKFPRAGDVRLCLRHHQRLSSAEALLFATRTLDAMAQGGMYDQLGGGFHRYSVDREWRVPHFEKMLYDNAQLLPAYLEAFTLTNKPDYAQVARGICEWALSEMQTEAGAFASSQDADSEGEEGRYFVWTRAELRSLLGAEQERIVASYFDVTDAGNFEHGKNVLWIPRPASEIAAQLGISQDELLRQVAEAKGRLLDARRQRVRPGTDDKVLTGWNALFVSGLALAHQVLDEPRYLDAAQRCMAFLLEHLTQPDGSLYGTTRGGRAHVDAGLDDYAYTIQALCDLYESSFDESYLERALLFKDMLEERFSDDSLGGYFTTAAEQGDLIVRLKSSHDGALPSGAAVQALNLARLAAFTSKSDLRGRAESALFAQGGIAQQAPYAFSHLLIAEDFLRGNPREVVIAGHPSAPQTQAMLRVVRGMFRPQRVVALAHSGAATALLPLLEGKTAGHAGARAYVCEDQRCLAPADTPEALQTQLSRQRAWAT